MPGTIGFAVGGAIDRRWIEANLGLIKQVLGYP
jgi:hypothetical protein